MFLEILNITVILVAMYLSMSGAYKVSGKHNTDRLKGYVEWRMSNYLWLFTFVMGTFGLITGITSTIQQVCAGLSFIGYILTNERGIRNNGSGL